MSLVGSSSTGFRFHLCHVHQLAHGGQRLAGRDNAITWWRIYPGAWGALAKPPALRRVRPPASPAATRPAPLRANRWPPPEWHPRAQLEQGYCPCSMPTLATTSPPARRGLARSMLLLPNPSRKSFWNWNISSLLRRSPADAGQRPFYVLLQLPGHKIQRFLPAHRHQLAILAHQRLRSGGRRIGKVVDKTPFVANPDFVDRLILARHDALDDGTAAGSWLRAAC
jgi:hypothetical protein